MFGTQDGRLISRDESGNSFAMIWFRPTILAFRSRLTEALQLFGIRYVSQGIVAILIRTLFVLLLCVTTENSALAGGRPPAASTKREHVNCAQTSDPDRSISACTAMLNDPSETRSNKLVAYNNRCLAYYHKYEYDQSIADCDQAIRLNSKYAVAYNNRCLVYRSKREYDRAIADCDQAIKVNPKYSLAYINRCSAYLGKHEYSRAIADCDDAIRLDPKSAAAYISLCWAYTDKREYDRAIADCDRAIKLGPKGADARNNRGVAFMGKAEYEVAIVEFDKAIELNPKYYLPYSNRGNAYRIRGDYDRAIADYDQAIKLDPKYVTAFNGRCLAKTEKREYDQAIGDCDQAIKLDPKFLAAYYSRGNAYVRKGDYDRAIADYNEAIDGNPKYALAYNSRGFAYQGKRDWERAISNYDEAIKIDPKLTIAYTNRAAAYRVIGDYARAIADYRKILDLPAPSAADRQRQDIARERVSRYDTVRGPMNPLSGRRVALVIGNSNYLQGPPLTNPKNDARAIAAGLRRLGFAEVIERYELGREAMTQALKDLGDRAEGAEWVVVYFAGHGLEMNGTNYLIPIDARLKSDTKVNEETISLDQVIAKADTASKISVVILDACRDNPFLARTVHMAATGRSIGRGLASVEPDGNVLVSFAAKQGTLALEGSGEHSPFAEALITYLEEPGLELNLLFRKVREYVREKTAQSQDPILYGLPGSEPLYFKRPDPR
jgi:tetratricopeptide (TPR) repeat protein